MYTHKLTKIGTTFMLKDNKQPESRPTIFKDFQIIETSLRRKGCWDTTEGKELLPNAINSPSPKQ